MTTKLSTGEIELVRTSEYVLHTNGSQLDCSCCDDGRPASFTVTPVADWDAMNEPGSDIPLAVCTLICLRHLRKFFPGLVPADPVQYCRSLRFVVYVTGGQPGRRYTHKVEEFQCATLTDLHRVARSWTSKPFGGYIDFTSSSEPHYLATGHRRYVYRGKGTGERSPGHTLTVHTIIK